MYYLFAFLFTGESIPIRLFLSGYELTPTMRDVNKKFSARYYLNLVLVDEEERRYFKQQARCLSECRQTELCCLFVCWFVHLLCVCCLPSVCLPVCLCTWCDCLFVCVSVCVSVRSFVLVLSFRPSVCPAVCLCLSVLLFVCLSVCVSVPPSVSVFPFVCGVHIFI